MNCLGCKSQLTEDMLTAGMCFNCGYPIKESVDAFEKEQKAIAEENQKIEHLKKEKMEQERKLQAEKAVKEMAERVQNHKLTSGYNFEGYEIESYLGMVSGEVVIGTGWLSNIEAGMADFFGAESMEYANKIKKAKKAALCSMIDDSAGLCGNAVIGVTYSILALSRDIIAVSVNGTSVIIK